MRPAQLPAPELTEAEILKKRIDDLEAELVSTREEYEAQRLERINAMRNMPEVRRLYSMLCLLFGHEDGQLHHVRQDEVNRPQAPDAWKLWKDRLPGATPKVIDALLVQPMTATQLIAATRTSYSTVQRALSVLRANSLTENDGERIKLRRL